MIKVISLILKYVHLIVTQGVRHFQYSLTLIRGANVIKSMPVSYGKLCKEIINFSNSLNNIAV